MAAVSARPCLFDGKEPIGFDLLDSTGTVLGQVLLVFEDQAYPVIFLDDDEREAEVVGPEPGVLRWTRHPDAVGERQYATRRRPVERTEQVALRVWNRAL